MRRCIIIIPLDLSVMDHLTLFLFLVYIFKDHKHSIVIYYYFDFIGKTQERYLQSVELWIGDSHVHSLLSTLRYR